jgi:hypothetical protein
MATLLTRQHSFEDCVYDAIYEIGRGGSAGHYCVKGRIGATAVSAGCGNHGPTAQSHLLNRGSSFAGHFQPPKGRLVNGELDVSGVDSFARPTSFTERGRIAMPNVSQSARED